MYKLWKQRKYYILTQAFRLYLLQILQCLFFLDLGQLSEHLKLEGNQLKSLQLLLLSAVMVEVVHDGNTKLLLL